MRIAVVGGGIGGLAAAVRALEVDPAVRVTVFDAAARPGGVLRTEQAGGYLLEHSADSFITTNPAAVELCGQIGLADELIETNSQVRSAFVVRSGKLVRVPEGFLLMAPRRLWPLVKSPILSPAGKLRLLLERFIPRRRAEEEESLAAFARRRLGNEAYERLVQPLVGGIYTADAEKLSLAATLPRFIDMERRHGSLTKGARQEGPQAADDATSGARYSLFVAPVRGMQSVVDALAAKLPEGALRLNTAVLRVTRADDGRWSVWTAGRNLGQPTDAPKPGATIEEAAEDFDGVIVALPAWRAAGVLNEVDSSLAADLAAIPYADSVLVLTGYRRDRIDHPLDGFGFVVPEIEGRRILACSFASVKFAGRAPEGSVLLRVFLGGAKHPGMADLSDDALKSIVRQELGDLLGARGEPDVLRIVRWRRAMPQYHVGHLDRVARIEEGVSRHAGLELAGNAYRGVGIPDCIKSGQSAVERLLAGA